MGRYLTVIVCGVSLILALQGRAAFGEPSGTPGCSCSISRQDCIPRGYACSLSDQQSKEMVRFVTECGRANNKQCGPTKWAERPLSDLARCSGVVAANKHECRSTKGGTFLVATRCGPVTDCTPKNSPRTYYCEKEEEFAGQDGLLPVQNSCGQCKDAASCSSATCSFIKIPKSDCTKRDGIRESEPCSWSSSGSPRVVTSPAPVTSSIPY